MLFRAIFGTEHVKLACVRYRQRQAGVHDRLQRAKLRVHHACLINKGKVVLIGKSCRRRQRQTQDCRQQPRCLRQVDASPGQVRLIIPHHLMRALHRHAEIIHRIRHRPHPIQLYVRRQNNAGKILIVDMDLQCSCAPVGQRELSFTKTAQIVKTLCVQCFNG